MFKSNNEPLRHALTKSIAFTTRQNSKQLGEFYNKSRLNQSN